MKKSKKIIVIIIAVILALLIAFLTTFFVLRYLGKKSFHENDKNINTEDVVVDSDDTVNYGGKKYKLNSDIVNILIMGVDKQDITVNEGYGSNGQADCLFLAAIDTSKKTFKLIPISRESMVDVDVYSSAGKFVKTEKEQLCLAYAYGDTPEKSCQNVLKSVKRIFFGLSIDSYVCIDLNGIAKISKVLGGIDVVSNETVSNMGYNFVEDTTYNLSGDKACAFIRARGTDIDANNRRMIRQKQLLSALITKAGNRVLDDFSSLASIYNTMMPYVSTNVDLAQTTYLASSCLTRDIGSRITYKKIEGSMSEGKFNEFNIDKDSLIKLIIETHYIEVKSKK